MNAMRPMLIVLSLAVTAAGCAPRQTRPPPEPEPPAPEAESERPPEDGQESRPGVAEPAAPRTMAEASGPAVVALLGQGEDLASAGDYEKAAASVERALDVEPRNPFVYQRLAELRLEQGQPEQAETLARKSNSLGGDNAHLQARNWALIARALRAQGDTVGADSAVSRAEYFRSRTQ